MSDLQEKYMEFKLLTEQLKELKKQVDLLDDQLTDTMYVSQSLDEMQTVEKNTDLLVPITSGIFVKARIRNPNSLVVNVGSDVCVQKSIAETQELLKEKLENIQEVRKSLISQFEDVKKKAEDTKKVLQNLSEEADV